MADAASLRADASNVGHDMALAADLRPTINANSLRHRAAVNFEGTFASHLLTAPIDGTNGPIDGPIVSSCRVVVSNPRVNSGALTCRRLYVNGS